MDIYKYEYTAFLTLNNDESSFCAVICRPLSTWVKVKFVF